MKGDPKAFDAVKKFITDSEFEIISEKEEQHCDRLDVKSGIFHCDIHIYITQVKLLLEDLTHLLKMHLQR